MKIKNLVTYTVKHNDGKSKAMICQPFNNISSALEVYDNLVNEGYAPTIYRWDSVTNKETLFA